MVNDYAILTALELKIIKCIDDGNNTNDFHRLKDSKSELFSSP